MCLGGEGGQRRGGKPLGGGCVGLCGEEHLAERGAVQRTAGAEGEVDAERGLARLVRDVDDVVGLAHAEVGGLAALVAQPGEELSGNVGQSNRFATLL